VTRQRVTILAGGRPEAPRGWSSAHARLPPLEEEGCVGCLCLSNLVHHDIQPEQHSEFNMRMCWRQHLTRQRVRPYARDADASSRARQRRWRIRGGPSGSAAGSTRHHWAQELVAARHWLSASCGYVFWRIRITGRGEGSEARRGERRGGTGGQAASGEGTSRIGQEGNNKQVYSLMDATLSCVM